MLAARRPANRPPFIVWQFKHLASTHKLSVGICGEFNIGFDNHVEQVIEGDASLAGVTGSPRRFRHRRATQPDRARNRGQDHRQRSARRAVVELLRQQQ